MLSKNQQNTSAQAGFVAIFTVLFFILLITVVTVGFLRVMSQEQRQSVDNDLTASALASAESGIEDAKRAIARYAKLPPSDLVLRPRYAQALRSPLCNALFGPTYPEVRDDLRLTEGVNGGQVSSQGALLQAYTCLTVSMDTDDYVGRTDAGKSDFIPLRASENYDSITVSWHKTSEDADKQPRAYAPGTLLYPTDGEPASWGQRGYPAYLRVQVFGYTNGNLSLDQLDPQSRTVFLVPSNLPAGKTETNGINLDTSDTRYSTKSSPIAVLCKGTPPNVNFEYACSVKLDLTGTLAAVGNNKTRFLRVTPIYGATNFKVELGSGAGDPKLVEVQPIIDSTGRANDVFRRIQARVRLDTLLPMPEYALETPGDICKNFLVTGNVADFSDSCL